MVATDRPMFPQLLGVLLLSRVSTAMLIPQTKDIPNGPDEDPTYTSDPNTIAMASSQYPQMPPDVAKRARFGQLNLPPANYTSPLPDYYLVPDLGPNNVTGTLPLVPGGGIGLDPCDFQVDGGGFSPAISQVPWFCICQICKRDEGMKGDRGDRGLPGFPGSSGVRGPTGFRGRPGFTGQRGLKGQKGDDGQKGEQGSRGASGLKGGRGYKGDKGDLGIAGPQGIQGPAGEDGVCAGSCDSGHGPPGLPGLPGSVGARGLPGLAGPTGPHGPGGEKGDTGLPGAPGFEGDKGDQGEQGLCQCSDGMDGSPGVQGPPGDRGDKGGVGSQGPMGLTGDKGSMGTAGWMGPPGPCMPLIQSAFSARSLLTYPKPNEPIPFSDVIYNRQMHFYPTEGRYRAPINGTYIFSYHLSVLGKVLKVGLFHNYYPIVKTTDMATSSQQVVLHLSSGDEVWLQAKDIKSNGMFVDSENSSTFSGYLLYPDNCAGGSLSREFFSARIEGTYNWGMLPGSTPDPMTTP